MSRRSKSPLPVYKGKFGVAQAERLLWRAGFGPRPGEAKRLARMGAKRAVKALMKPRGRGRLLGPAPSLEENQPLTPEDQWGHDHLWWFDRMARTSNPLQERMTLVWHDWFATSNDGVGDQGMMLAQNKLFRRYATGSFKGLLLNVTHDPAMLVWLSGNENTKESPNENYARELMELFTLGAGARYSEADVREQARALTGWTNDWGDSGYENFHFDRQLHDSGTKRIFRKSGNFDWQDACMLCLKHPDHPTFFVKKLWSYFNPTPLKGKTLKGLKTLYVRSGYRTAPVLQAILLHPTFYKGPRMVKPPIVHSAGLLRMRNAGVTTQSWSWVSENTGQRLFFPPNVSGWDDDAWLDTGTFRGRWLAAREAWESDILDPGDDATLERYKDPESPGDAVKAALAFWGNPTLSRPTINVLNDFAQRCDSLANSNWKKAPYRVMRQNALRSLIATSPDLQTC
ncbi:MAG: DUF1800 domain-containing protein [Actinobacteria bacterium]|nr:DUF1800 domain-containing protein [Actinomycetota bacterium]